MPRDFQFGSLDIIFYPNFFSDSINNPRVIFFLILEKHKKILNK